MINNTIACEIPWEIFISGTLFESSPHYMAGWISTIEDKRWLEPQPVNDYPRMSFQQLNLRHCTSGVLKEVDGATDDLGQQAGMIGPKQHRKAVEARNALLDGFKARLVE